MTNIPDLIRRLEAADGSSRELDLEIWWWGKATHSGQPMDADYKRANLQMDDAPRYTASVDSALTLGRNDAEQYAILEAIYCNWNDLYPLKRAILFGCAHALKARLP